MTVDPFTYPTYTIRRKLLKILGASFEVFDPDGGLIAFSKQKAFKLKEDIRVYADANQTEELLTIRARQIVDFGAAYDIIDARSGTKVGAARRKGLKSMLRDHWEVLDAEDRAVGTVQEDSAGLALLRRFLSNLIPQKFHLRDNEKGEVAILKVHFNPIVYRMTVTLTDAGIMDPRAIMGVSILIAAIEGRQEG